MLVSDTFIYVDFQKTGTVATRQFLNKLLPGKKFGRHHQKPPKELIDGTRLIMATVRDPWSWYLSLWAYNCVKKRATYKNLTSWRPFKINQGFRLNWKFGLKAFIKRFLMGWIVNYVENKALFSNVDNVENFQKWLRIVLSKKNAFLLNGAYDQNPISNFAGLMTYELVRLFCIDNDDLNRGRIKNFDQLVNYYNSSNYIESYIQTEGLLDNILAILKEHNIDVNANEIDNLRSKGVTMNASRQNRNIGSFYTPELVELVKEKEQFIIEAFNYNYEKITATK